MTARLVGGLAAHEHPVWEDFGPISWGIVGLAALFAAWVIWKAVRYTLDPGETEPDHIKRSILAEPDTVDPRLSSGHGGGPGVRAPGAEGSDGA